MRIDEPRRDRPSGKCADPNAGEGALEIRMLGDRRDCAVFDQHDRVFSGAVRRQKYVRRNGVSGTADHVGKCLAHPLPYPAAKRLVWRYMLAGFMALLGAFRAGLGAQHASVNGTPEIVMDSNTINWSLCCSSG